MLSFAVIQQRGGETNRAWDGRTAWAEYKMTLDHSRSHSRRLLRPPEHKGIVLTQPQRDGKPLNPEVFREGGLRQLVLPVLHTSALEV